MERVELMVVMFSALFCKIAITSVGEISLLLGGGRFVGMGWLCIAQQFKRQEVAAKTATKKNLFITIIIFFFPN